MFDVPTATKMGQLYITTIKSKLRVVCRGAVEGGSRSSVPIVITKRVLGAQPLFNDHLLAR